MDVHLEVKLTLHRLLRSGRRVPALVPVDGRAGRLFGLALALLLPPLASGAHAQRLLTLVSGVGQAASAADPGPSIGPIPAAVEVDLELLRSAPLRLEAPTPDGGLLVAERSVFEDRGGGDLMWSGGQPGAGYDTVVLTVEGGRLVGRFGAAGGGVYHIHAERDGRGGMAPIVGPLLDDWCGVGSGADAEEAHDGLHAHGFAAALGGTRAADPPRRVSRPQGGETLDILVAYTATAAENWAAQGGALAAIRHAGDYLKMVFRNNGIGVEPRIVHVARASTRLDRVGRDFLRGQALYNDLVSDAELKFLRRKHRADFVHLFSGEGPGLVGPCGQHALLDADDRVPGPTPAHGWTTNHAYCTDYAATFVHEIGHGLGANHPWVSPGEQKEAFKPYAFGHVNTDVAPGFRTVMASGGVRAPFFSTPRIRPHGAVVGVADERDNERLLRETVQLGVLNSDYLELVDGVPAPPSDLRVWLDGESARLSWKDNAPDADGYEVKYSADRWAFTPEYERLGNWRVPVDGRTEATVPLEHWGPGAAYGFSVLAVKGEKESPEHDSVNLHFPEGIEAPSDVSVTGIDVQWTDNSDNEWGFLVVVFEDGEPIAEKWAWADRTSASPPFYKIRPRTDELEVRVFAITRLRGSYSGSELVTFQWPTPGAPEAPTDVRAFAIEPTTARVTWVGSPEADSYRVDADAFGWSETYWVAGRNWVDVEGLARGGSYEFSVKASRDYKVSRRVRTRLAMGARGTGPRAPSNLTYVTYVLEGDWASLTWKDNSEDELGFEVRGGWSRLALLPPNTESAVISGGFVDGFSPVKVYAYNERGFSARTNPIVPEAEVVFLLATAGDTEVDLTWRVESAEGETVTGIQVRWTAAGTSFDDAASTWIDLPVSTRAYTVTGLENGKEYEFRVRAETALGAGRAAGAAATPRKEPDGSCRANSETLCLRNSRFKVRVLWTNAKGTGWWANVVQERTDDSGLFYFADPSNWEVLIKVLDGCETNGRMWVLGALTTDLEYWISVEDTVSGEWRHYMNEPGRPAPAIVDTEAFSLACEAGER